MRVYCLYVVECKGLRVVIDVIGERAGLKGVPRDAGAGRRPLVVGWREGGRERSA